MKAAIYIRVSTDEQKEHGYSLPEQEKQLKRYCAQNDYDIVEIFQDDHSAKTFDRPAFNKLLEGLTNKTIKINILLVTKIDRFSRNTFEAHGMLAVLKKFKVKVFSLNDGELDYDDSRKFFPLLIQSGAAQYENMLRAENTKRGMRQCLREGRFVWIAPVGYKNLDKTIIVDAVKAPLVKEAFTLMETGIYSADVVRKQLAVKGLKRSKQGFLNMLRNPFYTGKIRIDAWERGTEQEEIVKGLHEAIIDDILFENVQDVLNGKKKKFPASHKKEEHLPLRGFLECNICGGKLTGSGSVSRDKTKHYYYHCQHGCKERFRADTANIEFEAYLKSFQIPENVLQLYNAILEDVFSEDDKKRVEKITQIDSQIAKVKERLDNLQDKFVDDEITKKDFDCAKSRYQGQLNVLINEKTEMSINKSEFMKYIKFGFTLLSNLNRYYKNAQLDVKQKIVGSIFPEKLVFDRKNYRTTKTNALLELGATEINASGQIKKRQAKKNLDLSTVAPPSGLEPETL